MDDDKERSGETPERESEDRQSRGQPNEREEKKKFHVSEKALVIGGIILVVILVTAVLYWLHARNFASTDDAYTTAHIHEISARVAGTVENVLVEDNQFVNAGQPLLILDQRDFNVALTRARAQVLQRKAAEVQAQANLDRAQSDYDRVTALYQQDMKAVSKSDVDNVTAALKTAHGASEAAKADLAAAEATQADADLQLSYTKIVAPVDGVIGKKTVESGARIQPGQALMAVVGKDVWVLANYKETQLAKVRVGQHVDVRVDAVPDHLFPAHVDSFQPGTGAAFALLPPDNATGNFTKIVQRVPVKIVFDDLGEYRARVTPGLSCVPKIDLRTGPDR